MRTLILSSFLLVAGISLTLATHDGVRMKPFLTRLGMLAGCAALISVASYFMFGPRWIFFGVLHFIAVASVLGNVPEDLACVIDQLVQKDQTRRYPSAEHALADLAPSADVAAKIGDVEAEKQAAEKKRARRRSLAIGALAMSMLLSVGLLFVPTETKPLPAN